MYKNNLERVYIAIRDLAENGIAHDISYEDIAKKSGVPRRTTARAIAGLVRQGRIKKIHAKGRSICNIYEVL
jgi:DNA-binding IclR family transcriptional regulator